MTSRIDTILYNLLIETGKATKAALDDIIHKNPGANGAVLIQSLSGRKVVNEPEILKMLSEKAGIEYRPLKNDVVAGELVKKIPVKVASHYQFVPLSLENGILTIGVYYPLDIKTQDEIRFQLGFDVRQVLSNREDVLSLLRKNYGLGAQTIERMFIKGEDLERSAGKKEIDNIEETGEDATISNLVNQIILDAYNKRATDIHIEPYRDGVRFRYRIDGVLYDANVSPTVKNFIQPILSRIKIMSNLDIVERRLPQDGQAVVTTTKQRLDLRVSFIPSTHGESVVIRILPALVLFDMDKLGLDDMEKRVLSKLLESPYGIIFVTGPTGSGKTTTLYACLNKLNTSDKKIITIEDPVEYEMPAVTQIQVNPQIGLSFASGLRSMLRHDPDIMMVGEVRDMETAEIAIRVALTGHLVFSTLHTNNAASSVNRLMDIGIEPFLIHSSTIAFIAQRLVRVLCPKCKMLVSKQDPDVLELIKREIGARDEDIKIYRHVGCEHCNNTGYFGRTAIYEILEVNERIKELIHAKAQALDIEKAAIANGMRTLLQSGLYKVIKGETTIEEIVNIITLSAYKPQTRDPIRETLSLVAAGEPAPGVAETPKDKNDKRIYSRLRRKYPVTFSIYKKDITRELKESIKASGLSEEDYWEEHSAFSDDVSAGGLSFKSDIPLRSGTVLAITVALPFDISGKVSTRFITCLAKVVRSDASKDREFFSTAVTFLDMSSSDRNILNGFVEIMLKMKTDTK